MSVRYRHIVHQGRTLVTLGDVMTIGLRQQLGLARATTSPQTPGPEFVETLPPRPPELVKDFLRHIGGSPSAYKGVVPPHMFPQWVFPAAEKTLRQVPYPLFKMVNGGCKLEVRGELPAGVPLRVAARLEGIDEKAGQRVVLHQRVATGTEAEPELVVAHIFEVIPLGGGGKKGGKKKEKPRVPSRAREIALFKLGADAGLAFAALTGDFNPIHWLRPYAKAFGFRSVILHGFAAMARSIEGLNGAVYSGDTRRLRQFEARFTRPLVLPAKVGLYVTEGGGVFVGDAPGGPAYLMGTYGAELSEGGGDR